MEWKSKTLRRNAWRTVFKRGIFAWLTLVAVCLIFAYSGVSEAMQIDITASMSGSQKAAGSGNGLMSSNSEIIREYIESKDLDDRFTFLTSDKAISIIDACSKEVTWLVNILGANMAYVKRNTGEVITTLILAAIIAALIHFFINSTAVIGKNRYAMECRYSSKVSINRIFAPFHRKTLINLMWCMFRYRLSLTLWWITIIGGVYKTYQYRMVPFILAENPSVKWKEAKALSKQMTDGYKFKMFVTDITCIYNVILKQIPIIGILTAVPFSAVIDTEMYFKLRSFTSSELFIERAFDAPQYDRRNEPIDEPVYVLEDVAVEVPAGLKAKSEYTFIDFVFFFFVFSIVGWVWEELLYIVRDHVLVNRGSMYGPWLPIYGVGGVAIIFLLDRFKANKIKLFVLTVLLCGVLEFSASWILDFFFNSHYWDYHNDFMNVNGRIYLAGLIGFGIGGQLGVYVAAPKLKETLSQWTKKTQIIICVTLAVFFVADLICGALFGFNNGTGVGGKF